MGIPLNPPLSNRTSPLNFNPLAYVKLKRSLLVRNPSFVFVFYLAGDLNPPPPYHKWMTVSAGIRPGFPCVGFNVTDSL